MLALVTIFFSSLVIALSGAMMPGPLLTVTISESTQRGAKAGPVLIGGHALLELALLVALLFGLSPLFQKPMFFMVVSLAGGSIMLYMAWGMFKSIPSLSVQINAVAEKKNNLVVSGILMSLANPYWIVWWATIGLGYVVHAQKYGIIGIFLFYLGHIAGDLVWYWAISIAVAKGKKLFTDKTYKILIAVCGTFLVGFAFYLVIMALAG